MIDAVMPGFINLKLSDAFLQSYLQQMRTAEAFGIERCVIAGFFKSLLHLRGDDI